MVPGGNAPIPEAASRCAAKADSGRDLPQFKLTHYRPLTQEHNMNYVLSLFREVVMFRAVLQEAAALTSIVLFVGMLAIWSQVIGNL